MKKIVLGRTNQRVSKISLGTWSFGGPNKTGSVSVGWSDQNESDSIAALTRAWERKINHWDTADVYGDGQAEKIIGKMWKVIPRDDIFLATKVGWDKGDYRHWYHPKQMIKNMERSLKYLNTDCVDLLYLHHCNFGKDGEYFDSALEVLKKFKEAGKTRFIGLSDWSCKKIMMFIHRCDPDVVQPLRNLLDDRYHQSGLKTYVEKHNLGVCFFSPLKHGFLTGKYNAIPKFKDGDHRKQIEVFKNIGLIKKMRKNRNKLKEHFSNINNPVLHGIINALLIDSKTGCVLLGQRNEKQVDMAASIDNLISAEDAEWVKSLYQY
tara:strand:+ start:1716 stop:2678 length:963 start_codon:yes stop_codon:yes gene_type:complete